MNDALYRSFLEATRNVFEIMLDVEGLTQAPGRLSETGELSIAIPVTGALTGDIVYRFPKETSLNIVKIMSGGMEFSEVDDFVTSAVSEMANIISGKALIGLSERKVSCDILPPKILEKGEGNSLPDGGQGTSAKIHSSIGDLGIDVLLSAPNEA